MLQGTVATSLRIPFVPTCLQCLTCRQTGGDKCLACATDGTGACTKCYDRWSVDASEWLDCSGLSWAA